jgi:hypothetical protein
MSEWTGSFIQDIHVSWTQFHSIPANSTWWIKKQIIIMDNSVAFYVNLYHLQMKVCNCCVPYCNSFCIKIKFIMCCVLIYIRVLSVVQFYVYSIKCIQNYSDDGI